MSIFMLWTSIEIISRFRIIFSNIETHILQSTIMSITKIFKRIIGCSMRMINIFLRSDSSNIDFEFLTRSIM